MWQVFRGHLPVDLLSDSIPTCISAMKLLRLLTLALFVPLAASAAERTLKIDKAGTFLDVDVDATINFTAHLDAYEARVNVDDAGKIKGATFAFKFADLKSGKPERDTE